MQPAEHPDFLTIDRPEKALQAGRIGSVDLLRGLIMMIMALDHTRDFFTNVRFSPTDLGQTTPLLFFTRWITHFCAPTFVFLAGASAFLYGARGRSRGEISLFLLTRGLWLIVLEVTVVRFGLFFNLTYEVTVFQVIWAIGVSMVVLSALAFLPRWAILGIGLAMILGHNLADGIRADTLGALEPLWKILHQQDAIRLGPGRILFVAYPLIPWIGVMAAGYGFGPLLLDPDTGRRHRRLLAIGLGLTAAFAALRYSNLYGDPQPWGPRETPLSTLMSFLNTTKYPPSLCYLLMTLGPSIAALPMLESLRGPAAGIPLTFGRVPLFFYILHFYLIHILAGVAAVAKYGLQGALDVAKGPFNLPQDYGYSLGINYLVWAGVLAALYPACRWFARYKARHRENALLSYL
ncbi:MAG: heparan-alpha-glucosaminide N-acetyltransferase domain-containing protein [Isosphaeraceae bacterium]